jgi:hypothetical protein
MLFIIQLDIVPFEYWHVCTSLTVVRCREPVGCFCTPVPV